MPLRKDLLKLLDGGNAYVTFDEAIKDIPPEYYGAPVKNIPYTLWRILQHMKISQADILDYIQNPEYQELSWPEEYWPQEKAPPNKAAWTKSVTQFRAGRKALKSIVTNPKIDLLKPIPHLKNGPTLLHEILLVCDHNAYHIGQIILLRGLLGIWED